MMRTVRLELARNPGFPEGSRWHGYEIVLPLDGAGHVDPALWRANRSACRVRRFWGDEDDQIGEMIHGRQGWAISYRPGDDDDERLFRLDRHLFRPGEYITITEPDGAVWTYRVAAVS